MLKLVADNDIPEGFEFVNVNETNYSKHLENIEEQVKKALEEGTLQFVKKKQINEENREKEISNNTNEEASLGDFLGAMGSLMTAFTPKEDAEKLQEQLGQMTQMLSTAMANQSPSLVAETTIINSYKIKVTGIKDLKEGVENTTNAEVTKPDGSKEKIYVWIYPEKKSQQEKRELEFLCRKNDKALSLPDQLDGKMAIGLIYQGKRYVAVIDRTDDEEIIATVRDGKIVDINKGQLEETYMCPWMVGCTNAMTRARYKGTHFVKWDDTKKGGRWFECKISEQNSDGDYNVSAHDGDTGFFSGSQISKLGIQSSVGDTVIAYWDNRNYAFKGKHGATDTSGKICVHFDDGDHKLADSSTVHKLSTI